MSFVTFNDVNVGSNAYIDLAPGDRSDAERPSWRKFEVVGFKTRSFIYNFAPSAQAHELSLGGLAFDQVYAAAIKCDYDPEFALPAQSPDSAQRKLGNVGDPRAQLRLPKVDEVMAWLNSNRLATTQPFTAFVDVAKKAGNEDDLRELRISRSTKELWLRTQRLFGAARTPTPETEAKEIGAGPAAFASWLANVVSVTSDVVGAALGWVLWLVADHGYRPEKVGWFVLATIVFAGAYFWLCTGIIAFTPAKKNTIRPIGVLFLFDRLLPAYRIREDHYDIESFYKRAPKRRSSGAGDAGGVNVDELHLFGRKVPVIEANKRDVRRAELCLDIVKAAGLVLAVFLVAAINALVSH